MGLYSTQKASQPRRPTAQNKTLGAAAYSAGPPPPSEAWGGGEGPARARTQQPPRVRQPVPSPPRAPASWLAALSGAHGEISGSERWARTSVSPDGHGSKEGRDASEPPRDSVRSLTVCLGQGPHTLVGRPCPQGARSCQRTQAGTASQTPGPRLSLRHGDRPPGVGGCAPLLRSAFATVARSV